MIKNLFEWMKKEKILLVSGMLAVFTMFIVHPDREYLYYIDIRVICLLFCLMAVVEGFKNFGFFEYLASALLEKTKGGKTLGIGLVMLPFFTSMLVTNDVSLITFVPFTIMLLKEINCTKYTIVILVLQTVAANLGSMATPVGNPQNLFIYANYGLSAKEFFSSVLPLTFCSFLCLIAASIPVLPKKISHKEFSDNIKFENKIYIFCALFLLCLFTVFRVLPYGILTLIIIVTIFISDKKIFKNLDYGLLITFVFFFIVSGNLGRIDTIKDFLKELLMNNTLFTSIATSQIISNVPAAVLLSGFTENWKALLQGVNIGGLGTPIASLASLITLKIYLSEPGAKIGKFILVFTVINVIGILILASFINLF